tara:strand:- start:1892 stop:2548 length:657 start_codon:yes stop_codon:yes gene_type:complete
MGVIEYYKPYIYKKIPSVPIIHHIIVCIIINNMLINDTFDLCMITTITQSELKPMYVYTSLLSCTYGYFDLYITIKKNESKDLLLHGLFFSIGSTFVLYNNIVHWLLPFLLFETSSLFLNLLCIHDYVKYLFFIAFIFYRNILYPILFSYWVYHNEKLFMYEYNHEKVYFIFNILFGILNFYWGYKLIKKAIKTIKQKNENKIKQNKTKQKLKKIEKN